jgi:phosphoserine phosphatase
MREPHHFTWISPVIPQKELEGIYHWINHHLIEAELLPLTSFTRMKTSFCFEPGEALRLDFELSGGDQNAFLRFRESIWSELFASSHPSPRPHLVSLRPLSAATRQKKLACFDMDSTLINEEVIDEIARAGGFYHEVASVTEEAMQGKLDFISALKKRVRLFQGMPLSQALSILPSLTLSPGADRLLAHLRSSEMKTAVVSGGFEFILRHFKKQLLLDQVFGNSLCLDENEAFTGELDPPIVDAAYKQKLVARMKESYGFSSDEILTIGDGANDILMMNEAGTQVSFCGKPKLSAQCNSLILDRNLLWIKALL